MASSRGDGAVVVGVSAGICNHRAGVLWCGHLAANVADALDHAPEEGCGLIDKGRFGGVYDLLIERDLKFRCGSATHGLSNLRRHWVAWIGRVCDGRQGRVLGAEICCVGQILCVLRDVLCWVRQAMRVLCDSLCWIVQVLELLQVQSVGRDIGVNSGCRFDDMSHGLIVLVASMYDGAKA